MDKGKFTKQLRMLVSRTPHGSKFRQNFLKVAQANAVAKAMPIIAMPLLTRLFSPEHYATAAFYSTLLALLASFSTWRFDWSLPNTDKTHEAVGLLLVGFSILLFFCGGLILLLIAGDGNFLLWSDYASFNVLSFFLPAALLGVGLKALLSGWFLRANELGAVSRSTIMESGVSVGVSVIAGFLGVGALGLVLARTLSVWAGAVMLVCNTRGLISGARSVKFGGLLSLVRANRRETTWSTMVSFVNVSSFLMPLLLYTQFFETREVGWYALMMSTASAPIFIFASALGKSFWGQAAQLKREMKIEQLKSLYLRVTKKLCFASIPVIVVCMSGPLYVGFLFGAEWDEAGSVLARLTPLIVGNLIFSPTNHLIVFSKQSTQFFADIVRLFLTILGITIVYVLGLGFFMAVLMASIASLVGHLLLFYLHLRVYARY